MDEPTLGLDPQTTLSIRELIRDINKNGTTVILTTHAMLEAEASATGWPSSTTAKSSRWTLRRT